MEESFKADFKSLTPSLATQQHQVQLNTSSSYFPWLGFRAKSYHLCAGKDQGRNKYRNLLPPDITGYLGVEHVSPPAHEMLEILELMRS